MTLATLLNLSKPQFPYLKKEENIASLDLLDRLELIEGAYINHPHGTQHHSRELASKRELSSLLFSTGMKCIFQDVFSPVQFPS